MAKNSRSSWSAGISVDRFSLVDTRGTPPTERYGHSAVLEETGGGVMVVFGGCNKSGTSCADVFHYNIENKTWTQVTSDPPASASTHHATSHSTPVGRHFHTAVLYEGAMYVFGGTSNGFYNDLHRYTLDTGQWSAVHPATPPPAPRYGHSAVVYGHCMYVFGGYDSDGFPSNELFRFSFQSGQWSRLRPRGVIPKDRYHHTAVVHEGSMYVFGGHRCFNELLEYRFSSDTWSLVNSNGVVPKPMWGHRAVVHDDVMYVLGGRDAVATFSTQYEFCMSTHTWTETDTMAGGMSARAFHTIVAHDDSLYVFGGRNVYNYVFNELYAKRCGRGRGGSGRSRALGTLQEDYRGLVNDPALADVAFCFPHEDGRTLHAHRAILAARSGPFAAMFRSGMRESSTRVLDMPPNVRSHAFLALLDYIYTGRLFELASEYLVDLLLLADMYQLEHLKMLVERRVTRYVDSGNVASLLQLAEKYKAPELRDYCLAFLSKNPGIDLSSVPELGECVEVEKQSVGHG